MERPRFVRLLSKFFDNIAIVANAAGTLVVLVLVAVMNVEVVARGVFSAPFLGVVEVVVFSMVLIVFLQLPDVVRVNRLTRSDGFLGIVRNRRPRIAQIMNIVIDSAAFLLMATVAYATWPELIESFESCHYFTPPDFGPAFTGDLWTDLKDATARCDYFGTLGVFTVPWWPARLAITASAGLCAILFLFKVIAAAMPDRSAPSAANNEAAE